MRKSFKKFYRKCFKNKNGELQKLNEEFNMLRSEVKNMIMEINMLTTEINKLRKNNLLVSNQCDISVSNPYYFVEDDHIYTEVMQKQNHYEKINTCEGELTPAISSDVPPQLPPRNEINNIGF